MGVHQTGAADFERVRAAYDEDRASAGIVDLRAYLDDMSEQYARADLVISRAGAATLSELAACGKVAILIPFPFASDDHQRKNAESLAVKGAAVVIMQKDLTPARLRSELERLRAAPDVRMRMSLAMKSFHQPHAAENLVDKFVERIELDASR